MADENPVTVGFTANIQGLVSGLKDATSAVQASTAQMSASFGNLAKVMDGIKAPLLAITSLLAGGKIFKGVIDGTVQWETEALKLSRTLGITTEQASVLKVALVSTGVETDSYVRGVQMMTRQLAAGGEGFKKLGIETTDSNGHLRSTTDLMTEVVAKLNGLQAGTDRNAAATAVFGRGWREIEPILYLNADAMKAAEDRARSLHLIVGPEGAALARQYKIGLQELKLVGTSLEVQMGSQLLPTLTRLGSWFSEEGPALASGFAAAIQYVTVGFLGLKAIVETVVTAISAAFTILYDDIVAYGRALTSLVHGDFQGAVDAIKKGASEANKDWVAAGDNIAASWSSAMSKSMQVLHPPKPPPVPKAEGEHYDPENLKAAKEAHEARLAQLREEMEEQRRNGAQRIALAEAIVAEEIRFNGAGSKEAIKAQQELVKVQHEVGDERRALLQEQFQTEREFSLKLLEGQEKDLERKVKEGRLSIAEELQATRQLEDQKYKIKHDATTKELALDGLTDKEKEKLRRQELLDDAEHQRAMGDAASRAMLQETERMKSLLSPLRSGFNKLFDDILKGSVSFAEIWSTIWQGMAQMGIKALLDLGEQFIASKLAEIVLGKATAQAEIPAAAAVGGANAAAGAALAFWWQPELAIGIGAAMSAGIEGTFGGMASAAGGWAIPNNINPIMQAHGGEHVIPKNIAKRYESGAPGAKRGNSNTFHINAMDGKSVERTLRDLHRKGRFR